MCSIKDAKKLKAINNATQLQKRLEHLDKKIEGNFISCSLLDFHKIP
jgi:hypothetical protein